MEDKKRFVIPELIIIEFSNDDIISDVSGPGNGGYEPGKDDWWGPGD